MKSSGACTYIPLSQNNKIYLKLWLQDAKKSLPNYQCMIN